MAKQDIVEHLEGELERTESEPDLEEPNRCAHCDTLLPYEEYNQHSPQTDFIIHTMSVS